MEPDFISTVLFGADELNDTEDIGQRTIKQKTDCGDGSHARD